VRFLDLIAKKRDGGRHTPEELQAVARAAAQGLAKDYQLSAWLMAVLLNGMDERETVELTRAMARSGETLGLGDLGRPKADKHSTGGVGDGVSLALAPLAAACGLAVPMMSGRGLGHTGGTLDKLESIDGFQVRLDLPRIRKQIEELGFCLFGQTGELAPADRVLYQLRDATATVPAQPLIVSSILSKKAAEELDALVLDVKVGSGAFMKTLEEARGLAQAMVRIGTLMGRKVHAVITDMDQPLGKSVGNALEVQEAMDTLKGGGPADLQEVVVALAAQLLVMTGKAKDTEAATKVLEGKLKSGEAFEKFTQFVLAQGGKPGCWDRMRKARHTASFEAPQAGVVAAIDCEGVGIAAMKLGAGRETKDSHLDLAAGLVVNARLGDTVDKGQALCELHYDDPQRLEVARAELAKAFRIAPPGTKVEPRPNVHGLVTA
jgi:pyrimidine-nucleoside phosphorylase